ncbi:MAG: GumC family protein [bacterium]|nr:GumC family protein [bacterium]
MDEYRILNRSARDIVAIFFKYKWKMLLTFMLVTSLSIFIILIQKPVYESQAKILVKEGRENATPTTSFMTLPERIIDITRMEDINSEIEILRSRILAEKVVAKLGVDLKKSSDKTGRREAASHSTVSQHLTKIFNELKSLLAQFLPFTLSPRGHLSSFEQAVLRIQKNLDVELIQNSNVIRVSFSDPEPTIAADVINTLLDFYLDQHLLAYKTQGAYQFFYDQAVNFKQKMEASEQKLEEFKKRYSLAELSLQRDILIKQEGEYENSLRATESAISGLKKQMQQQKEQLANQKERILLTEISRRDPLRDQLSSQLSTLKLREQQLLNTFADANQRKIADLRKEIQEVECQLSELDEPVQFETQVGLNSIYLKLTEAILQNQAELEALEAKRQSLAQNLALCRQKLADINMREMELNQLQRQLRIDEENYQLYRKKMEENRISEAMDAARFANISIIEPALVPLLPKKTMKWLRIFVAFILGITASFGVALLSELLDHTVETPDELEASVDLPVLGSIPEMKE